MHLITSPSSDKSLIGVIPHTRFLGTHIPGKIPDKKKSHRNPPYTYDWREIPGSSENTMRIAPCIEFIEIDEVYKRIFQTEAHFVCYKLYDPDGRLVNPMPRITDDAIPWLESMGYLVLIDRLAADIDTPGHVEWTAESRKEWDSIRRKATLLDTADTCFSPRGIRAIQDLDKGYRVQDARRSLISWLYSLKDQGVWPSVVEAKDWNRNMRVPNHTRNGSVVLCQEYCIGKGKPIPLPPPMPTQEERGIRKKRVVVSGEFLNSCPPEYSVAADAIGAAIRDTVHVNWRPAYMGIAGALIDRGVPPEAVPSIVERAHLVDPEWQNYASDRVTIARTTVARAESGIGYRGHAFLYDAYPEIARVISRVVESREVYYPLPGDITPTPCGVATDALYREMIRPRPGLYAWELSPGMGKTQVAIKTAKYLLEEGRKIAFAVPTHELARQIMEYFKDTPGVFHLMSPASFPGEYEGHGCFRYAASKAMGTQRHLPMICGGNGRKECPKFHGCAAKEAGSIPPGTRVLVVVHQNIEQAIAFAGKKGVVFIDEIINPIETVSIDPEMLDATLEEFTPRYASVFRLVFVRLKLFKGPLEEVGAFLGKDLIELIRGLREYSERVEPPPINEIHRERCFAITEIAVRVGKLSALMHRIESIVTSKKCLTGNLRLETYKDKTTLSISSANMGLIRALELSTTVHLLSADFSVWKEAYEAILPGSTMHYQYWAEDGFDIHRSMVLCKTATAESMKIHGRACLRLIRQKIRVAVKFAKRHGLKTCALITHKFLRDFLENDPPEEIRDLLASAGCKWVFGHYFAILGLDSMKDLDGLITIGDPWMSLAEAKAQYAMLSITQASFDQWYRLKCASELGQAQDRIRPPHRTRYAACLHIGDVIPRTYGWQRFFEWPMPEERNTDELEGRITGAELKRIRIEQGLSQQELADILGITSRAIRKMESGEMPVTEPATTWALQHSI